MLNEVAVTSYDVIARPRLDKAELIAVDAAQAGLVFFDGELVETLGPGRYGYWQIGRTVTSKGLDTHPLPLEVTALATPDYVQHVYKLVRFAAARRRPRRGRCSTPPS